MSATLTLDGRCYTLRAGAGSFRVSLLPEPCGGSGLEGLKVVLEAPEAASPPRITLVWREPLVDAVAIWTTAAGRQKGIAHVDIAVDEGEGAVTAKATAHAPVICVVSAAGQNRLCFASSDALHPSRLKARVVEETGELECEVQLFLAPPSPGARFEVQVRLDRRPVRYERALGELSTWWAERPGHTPAPVPERAQKPMLSTWYSFHQALEPGALLAECRLAAPLGCEAIIIDDGWQTLDTQRGYGFAGDWEPERLRDLAGLVRDVHALGLKTMLWYAVPWVGTETRTFARFRDRLLYVNEKLGAGALDPRYPEVREAIIGTYERALREWKIDGVKLDFVDRFRLDAGVVAGVVAPPASAPGRDFESVDEAVDRLLGDVMTRLRALDPEVLVEFRQPYVGPLMRRYGNMFRAGDCAADLVRNRVSVIDLRLLAGSTAVHADMLMWHPADPPESAALQLLAVLFGVPQISVRLGELPPPQLEMLRFWLGFWRAQRQVLLQGELRAIAPELNYPLVLGSTASSTVAAAYADVVVALAQTPGEVHLVNATRGERLALELGAPAGERVVRVHDCRGRLVSEARRALGAGVHRLEVPPAGLVSLVRER